MSGEAWLYLFAVIINAVNLFLQVFFTIMYSDLEWYGIPWQDKHMGWHGGRRRWWWPNVQMADTRSVGCCYVMAVLLLPARWHLDAIC